MTGGYGALVRALGLGYLRWRAGRSLDGVWIGGEEHLRAALAAGPVILASNHVGWWDGPLALLVDAHVGADGRLVVLGDSVRRLPFLRHFGAIPLGEGLAAWGGLRTAAAHLTGPGRSVWIYPQGRSRPAGVRPLGFRPGVELLVRRSQATLLPVAIDYPFRDVHAPAAVVSVGPPTAPGDAEAAVLRELDRLTRWVDAGSPAQGFSPLVPSRFLPIQDRVGARLLGATGAPR